MNEKSSPVHELIEKAGGLKEGVAREVAEKTGLSEAQVYGSGSFYHLLAEPEKEVRVCTGLSCRLAGSEQVLAAAQAVGLPATGCSCLAGCDVAPAVLNGRRVLPRVTRADVNRSAGNRDALKPAASSEVWRGKVFPERDDPERLVLNLHGRPDWSARALARARELGGERVIDAVEEAGLRGRGGAGFPAFIKWKGVRGQKERERYLVLNADEGEPGTFKDREIMLRRPDLVLEGLTIAAEAVGAHDVYLYLRGEFEIPWSVMKEGITEWEKRKIVPGIRFHMHAGQGAYICGEETALLEALEGKRGMPRLKPPFPVEVGLFGKPTLIHNVESIACVPAILKRGADWYRALGRTEPGTKLYCLSGHVREPGAYEMPFGVSLDELVAAAGGYAGKLKAFSPGGASSGFLPAAMRALPLDFKALADAGSMLGSAGVVVLNETVDMKWALREQLRFFENESCGQCAPCRIGTRYLGVLVDKYVASGDDAVLNHVRDVAWQMQEGSICGLGQAAHLPLTSALKHFPEEFRS